MRAFEDMNRNWTRRSVLGAAAMVVWLAPGDARSGEGVRTGPLTIVTGTQRHRFTVELARTVAERAQGLMFRERLAPDRGMLFLYERDRVITMWMKNTLIPLDMLFLDARGRVVAIHERAVPGSLRPISSGVRARAVLEVAGGTAARIGLRPGDRVIHEALAAR
jgi:hypothetical protein